MLNYVCFGVSVLMLMVSLAAGSFGWAAGWMLLMLLTASFVADTVQTREVIARIPDELKAEMYLAIMAAKAGN